jgi:hypothetical protein
VPRDTKKLVAGVGDRKREVDFSSFPSAHNIDLSHQEPELINGLLNSIQSISDEARRCLADPELSREQLLNSIGVSRLENYPGSTFLLGLHCRL